MAIYTTTQDEASVEDTYIDQNTVDDNYGIADTIRAGTSAAGNKNRGLIKFDLTPIPAGAIVKTAELSLYCSSEGAAADEDVSLHRSLVQWYEGDADGGSPSGDGSTWNYQNNNGSDAWDGESVGGLAGVDYAATPTDTQTITGAGATFTWDVAADVQAFIDGDYTNYGWWLINDDEVSTSTIKRFDSSTGATASQRPVLVVEYELAHQSTIKITDGVTEVDIGYSGSDYHILWGEWNPKIAQERDDEMGNRSPVYPTEEVMKLHATGDDAPTIRANIETLAKLIRQAHRWYKGTNELAVKIQYSPKDSTEDDPVEDLVFGSSYRGEDLELPKDYDALKDGLTLNGVTLRFTRSGYWYGATETATDEDVVQGDTAAGSLTAVEQLSPVVVTIGGFGATNSALTDSIVLLAAESADIDTYSGEAGSLATGGGSYASLDESARHARNDDVGRLTWSSGWHEISWSSLASPIAHELIGLVAVVRNNSSARTWQMYAETRDSNNDRVLGRTEMIVVDGSSTSPQPVFLGFIVGTPTHGGLSLWIQADGGTNPTFDIDEIWIIGLDNPTNRIITLLGDTTIVQFNDIIIDPQQLTGTGPRVYGYRSSPANEKPAAYHGDAWVVTNDDIYGVFISTKGTVWVWTDAGGTVVANDWTFDRQAAYLIPR